MSSKFRHITPVPRKTATGGVAAVYEQTSRELGATALEILSPAADVLVPTWALLRESLLAGTVPRVRKEIVATTVSVANDCPFCVDAHAVFMHAAGAHDVAEAIRSGELPADPQDAALSRWAAATRKPDAPELTAPPFGANEAPEYVGTALAFHFINRMTSVLSTTDAIPGGLQRFKAVRRLGGMAFARAVKGQRASGASLSLLADLPSGAPPAWAAGGPIGAAYAALHAAATAGPDALGGSTRDAVIEHVERWDGEHPPMVGGWWEEALTDVAPDERPAAKLALLAAMAPYRVTEDDVAAWRRTDPDDGSLVRLLAFGAMVATQRCETAIVAAPAAPAERSAR